MDTLARRWRGCSKDTAFFGRLAIYFSGPFSFFSLCFFFLSLWISSFSSFCSAAARPLLRLCSSTPSPSPAAPHPPSPAASASILLCLLPALWRGHVSARLAFMRRRRNRSHALSPCPSSLGRFAFPLGATFICALLFSALSAAKGSVAGSKAKRWGREVRSSGNDPAPITRRSRTVGPWDRGAAARLPPSVAKLKDHALA